MRRESSRYGISKAVFDREQDKETYKNAGENLCNITV